MASRRSSGRGLWNNAAFFAGVPLIRSPMSRIGPTQPPENRSMIPQTNADRRRFKIIVVNRHLVTCIGGSQLLIQAVGLDPLRLLDLEAEESAGELGEAVRVVCDVAVKLARLDLLAAEQV